MDNELGTRIRTLRKERGLSQEALAQALEVSRQAVTKWEDGSSLPSTANLFALSGFFGVSLAELTGTPDGTLPQAYRRKHAISAQRPCALHMGAVGRQRTGTAHMCRTVFYMPDRLFQRMFRSSAALIWRQTSTLWAGSLHICF